MTRVPKWAATGVYIALFGVLGLLAVIFGRAWSVVLLPVIWVWTVFNLIQVWRGKRERLWR